MNSKLAALVLVGLVSLSANIRVDRVVDGDTFRLENGQRVRLIGINAPELDTPFGDASKRYLQQLIEGKTVELQEDGISNREDQYGRLLRYVILDGEDINEKMVRDGYAYAFLRYDFDKRREYKESETTAKQQGLGLWGEDVAVTGEGTDDNEWNLGLVLGILVLLILAIVVYALERKF